MNAAHGFVYWVSWLYLVTNTVRIAFYAPQIVAVCRSRDAAAVSITTWAFWTFANFTAALYGAVAVHDKAFTFIFLGNFVCTGAVTLIATAKRLRVYPRAEQD
jgi:uncharacterized protein with PQ loop repeat